MHSEAKPQPTTASIYVAPTSNHREEPSLVEVHARRGIPYIEITGAKTPDVRESRIRVRAAIESAGFRTQTKRIAVNVVGGTQVPGQRGYDLAISLGVLACTKQLSPNLTDSPFGAWGEVRLDGSVKASTSTLDLIETTRERGIARWILPKEVEEMVLRYESLSRKFRGEYLFIENLSELKDHKRGILQKEIKLALTRRHEGATLSESVLRRLLVCSLSNHSLLLLGVDPTNRKSIYKTVSDLEHLIFTRIRPELIREKERHIRLPHLEPETTLIRSAEEFLEISKRPWKFSGGHIWIELSIPPSHEEFKKLGDLYRRAKMQSRGIRILMDVERCLEKSKLDLSRAKDRLKVKEFESRFQSQFDAATIDTRLTFGKKLNCCEYLDKIADSMVTLDPWSPIHQVLASIDDVNEVAKCDPKPLEPAYASQSLSEHRSLQQ